MFFALCALLCLTSAAAAYGLTGSGPRAAWGLGIAAGGFLLFAILLAGRSVDDVVEDLFEVFR